MVFTDSKKLTFIALLELAAYSLLLIRSHSVVLLGLTGILCFVSLSEVIFSRWSQIAAVGTLVLLLVIQIQMNQIMEKSFYIWHCYLSLKYIGLTFALWYQINKKGKDFYVFPYQVSSIMLSMVAILPFLKRIF